MQVFLSLLLAICVLPAPSAADVTVGTVMLLNEGLETSLKCNVEEHDTIQRVVSDMAPSMSGRREQADCDLCYIYFPQNLAYCYFLYPRGECSHLYRQRQLRAEVSKADVTTVLDDVTSHPKYEAKCKQQSKALARMVTNKKFLSTVSPECDELLSQKMKFVCIVTED